MQPLRSQLNLLALLLVFCTAAITFCQPAGYCQPDTSGQLTPKAGSHVSAKLIAETTKVQPGLPFLVGVELTMQDGWHTYYKDSGDAGMPTKITWSVPPGTKIGPLRWPKPQRMNDAGIVTNGYTGRVILSCELTPPNKIDSKWFNIRANVKWLECKEACIPGEAVLSLSLPVGSANSTVSSTVNQTYKPTGSFYNKLELPVALLFALIGGFILNFMPCVLPVISIKIMNLVNEAAGSRQSVIRNGLMFSCGIIASFEVLAIAILSLRAAGQGVGWGFQFQYPEFSIAMAAIILVLALSLFGVFYISPGDATSGIDKLASKGGITGTFFNGVLATVLATPCTAPFLGTAMGFAFVEPSWIVLTIFFVVGLGMSLPYLLLTTSPGWMKYIPKPGDWMETYKQAMGFVLLATIVWLLYVINGQLGSTGVLSVLAFLLIVSIACWLTSRLIDLSSSNIRKIIVWLSVAVIVCLAYVVFLKPILPSSGTPIDTAQTSSSNIRPVSTQIDWKSYSAEALNSAIANKQTVLVDFTADWCLTCKVNEKTVLDSTPIIDKLKLLHVMTLKADWTNRNPEITNMLQKFGRFGVPLYVIFPANRPDQPIVLPEVITQGIMLDKLNEAGPSLQ